MVYKKNKNYKRKSSKAKKNYSASEKASYKRGFFAGLFASKKNKSNKKSKKAKQPKKLFGFLAFNQNCDVFNVHSEGTNRSDALKNARKHLKRDPEVPFWGVTITDDKENADFYRHVTVDSSGSVFDSWKPHYRNTDDDIRRKYKDLSKPVDGYEY